MAFNKIYSFLSANPESLIESIAFDEENKTLRVIPHTSTGAWKEWPERRKDDLFEALSTALVELGMSSMMIDPESGSYDFIFQHYKPFHCGIVLSHLASKALIGEDEAAEASKAWGIPPKSLKLATDPSRRINIGNKDREIGH